MESFENFFFVMLIDRSWPDSSNGLEYLVHFGKVCMLLKNDHKLKFVSAHIMLSVNSFKLQDPLVYFFFGCIFLRCFTVTLHFCIASYILLDILGLPILGLYNFLILE